MKKSQDLIGVREYTAIVIIIIGIKLTDDTPSILHQSLLNAAWMAPIIIGLLIIIPLFLLIKVIETYESKNLIDVILHLFGKYIGHFVLFILWGISLTVVTLDSAIYVDIIETMYFPNTPIIVIYATLIGVSAYGAKKGLEQIGSVAWIILPYIKVSLLIALILTMGNGQVDFVFPILGPGAAVILKESSLKASIYMDFLYLCFIIPYMKNIKEFKKGTLFALIILTIEMSIAIIAYLLLFDFETVNMLNYPFHEVLRFIHLGFLTNIEMFFVPFWLMATFVRFSIYLYLNVFLFGKIFKVKHFESLIPIIATIIVFIGLIPESHTFTLYVFRERAFTYLTPLFFFLPCMLWVFAKFRGRFKQ